MMLKEPVIRYLESQKDPKYVDSSWNIDVLFTRQQSKSEMLNGNDLKCLLQFASFARREYWKPFHMSTVLHLTNFL